MSDYVPSQRLEELLVELQDERHHVRGADGFERPLYVSPAKWAEVRLFVAELLARRKRSSTKENQVYEESVFHRAIQPHEPT